MHAESVPNSNLKESKQGRVLLLLLLLLSVVRYTSNLTLIKYELKEPRFPFIKAVTNRNEFAHELINYEKKVSSSNFSSKLFQRKKNLLRCFGEFPLTSPKYNPYSAFLPREQLCLNQPFTEIYRVVKFSKYSFSRIHQETRNLT